MGYNPAPDDQWTQDDLDRATAAKDYAAINRARHGGHLHDILNPPKELSDGGRLDVVLNPAPPAGPTVPGQQPGAASPGGYGSGAPMTQSDLDALAAVGDHAAINEARRAGRLSHLGVGPSKAL